MPKDSVLLIIDSNALPDVFLRVLEAKRLIETGKAKTILQAVDQVGISRSAFYKYRNSVFVYDESAGGKTITFAMNLEDTPGLLSHVLNITAESGANVLTINQTIPINGVANVTVTVEAGTGMSHAFDKLKELDGVLDFKILATREGQATAKE